MCRFTSAEGLAAFVSFFNHQCPHLQMHGFHLQLTDFQLYLSAPLQSCHSALEGFEQGRAPFLQFFFIKTFFDSFFKFVGTCTSKALAIWTKQTFLHCSNFTNDVLAMNSSALNFIFCHQHKRNCQPFKSYNLQACISCIVLHEIVFPWKKCQSQVQLLSKCCLLNPI